MNNILFELIDSTTTTYCNSVFHADNSNISINDGEVKSTNSKKSPISVNNTKLKITESTFKDNIADCYKELTEVDTYITSNFDYLSRQENEYDHPYDKSGKSKIHFRSFHLESGDVISTACFDWSKEMKYLDNLRIGLITSELNDWFGIAYN